jgi:hypothetical protein
MQLHMTFKNNKFIDMKFNKKLFTADSITIQVLVRLCHQYQTSTFIQTSPGQPLNLDYEYSRAANPLEVHLKMLCE